METAARAQEEREGAVENKNELLSTNIDEAAEFNEAYNELGEYIDTQNNMLEESIAKAAKAVKFETDGADNVDTRGMLSIDTEKEVKVKLREYDNLTKQQNDMYKNTEEKIRKYKENFDELRSVSQLQDIDEITAVFCKNEEETFSLFNFIQVLNQETDHTQQQVELLEDEIAKYSNDQIEQESERQKIVQGFKEQVLEAKEERKRMALLAGDEQKTVEKIAKKVQGLFYKIQCDQLLEKSGGKGKGGKGTVNGESRLAFLSGQSVDENNILQFVGLIEERAVQIIGDYSKHLSRTDEGKRRRRSVSLTQSQAALQASLDAAGPRPKVIEVSDDEGSDTDEDRVLSIAEMKGRVKDALKKKHKKGAAGRPGRRERLAKEISY